MAESWWQLTVHAGAANLDALANFLVERGSPGVVLKRNAVQAYFLRSAAPSSLRREVRRFIAALARLSPRRRKTTLAWRVVKQEDWQDSWKRFIKPRRVGKSFWVTPPWLKPPKFRYRKTITIAPGMAFGTGTHATTRGCMEFIEAARERLGTTEFSALDVGTGSGVLAIVLAFLGAKPIYAVDNDPVALRVARENLRINGVAERAHLSGATPSALRRRFDLVVANLTAETILNLADALEKKVAEKGFLILSGILHHQAGAVTARFAVRFRLRQRKRSREWVTLLLQRN
ncbi:MAG: 50S ribosomal protein L11 methyltransferase [Chloroflexota bacterium]